MQQQQPSPKILSSLPKPTSLGTPPRFEDFPSTTSATADGDNNPNPSNLSSVPCPPITSSPEVISSPPKVPIPNICGFRRTSFYPCVICYNIFGAMKDHASHMIDVHPEEADNIYELCPQNECSTFEVANILVNGCECPCDL